MLSWKVCGIVVVDLGDKVFVVVIAQHGEPGLEEFRRRLGFPAPPKLTWMEGDATCSMCESERDHFGIDFLKCHKSSM